MYNSIANWCVDKLFKEDYTTSEKVSKEDAYLKLLKPEKLEAYSKSRKLEKDKDVISGDAFAIGSMIEVLINTWRNK